MRLRADFELPPELEAVHRKAVRLEWFSIVYLATAIAVLAAVLGSSQAMKAAWIEDILSLLPPLAFLVAARWRDRPPNDRFPYGYHRSVGVAYLTASAALLAMGGFILYDSAMVLVRFEHPSIGLIELFGQQVWLGWLMIGALLYSGLPPVLLGRAKQRLAAQLHDKVLYADAEMNKADWATAGAAILGVIGIGAGLWWADAVAAIVISLDIVHDGYGNVRTAVHDLMDRRPTTYDHAEPLPLVDEVEAHLGALPWVARAEVRLREEGHVLVGEAYVVPVGSPGDVPQLVERTTHAIEDLDWRLHDVAVVVLPRLDS
ncbi:MAG TPA: cation diffusion facilitator family transporter [Jiangellales bacterium]|nr:cation diffusion facilitator family transporter [Jiangellales bacterium]